MTCFFIIQTWGFTMWFVFVFFLIVTIFLIEKAKIRPLSLKNKHQDGLLTLRLDL